MSLTDPVADLLTRIRNSIHARHQKLDIPASKLKLEIARILKEEGYIANFKATEEEGRKVLRVYLKYSQDNTAAIANLQRISRPGCRVYVGRNEIPRVLGGLGINILTTPKGVMTGRWIVVAIKQAGRPARREMPALGLRAANQRAVRQYRVAVVNALRAE